MKSPIDLPFELPREQSSKKQIGEKARRPLVKYPEKTKDQPKNLPLKPDRLPEIISATPTEPDKSGKRRDKSNFKTETIVQQKTATTDHYKFIETLTDKVEKLLEQELRLEKERQQQS